MTCPSVIPMLQAPCPEEIADLVNSKPIDYNFQESDLGLLHSDCFLKSGLSIMPRAASENQVNTILDMCLERIATAEAALTKNHRNIKLGEDAFTFSEISSRGNQRFDLLLERTEQLEIFERSLPWVQEIIEPILGSDWTAQVHFIYIRFQC